MVKHHVWAGLVVLMTTQVMYADVVYDNGVGSDEINAGGVSDDARESQPQFADDFELGQTSTVNLIRWWGYYDNGALPPDDFRVEFYEDNGGLPEDAPFLTVTNPTTRVDSGDTFVGFDITIYEFTMALDDEMFGSNTRLWVSVVNDTAPDTVYVAGGNSSDPGLTASRLNNPPPIQTTDWNPSSIELAFQLEGTVPPVPAMTSGGMIVLVVVLLGAVAMVHRRQQSGC